MPKSSKDRQDGEREFKFRVFTVLFKNLVLLTPASSVRPPVGRWSTAAMTQRTFKMLNVTPLIHKLNRIDHL